MTRRQVELDQGVAAILAGSQPRARNEPPAARRKVTLEMNSQLADLLKQVAKAQGVSPAALADVLLARGLEGWASGELVLNGELRPSRSPRYQWTVEVATEDLAAHVAARLREG